MADVYEIRHDNLLRLIQEYGSIAEINERLGRKRNDAALTIVKNRSVGSRGKPREMGSTLARKIEQGLGLDNGWMDTDHTGIVVESAEDDYEEGIRVLELENWGSMGTDPAVLEQDVILGGITLSPEFVRRLNPSSPKNLKVITGHGDSMSPTILPGDKILIDEGVTDLCDGIYVLQSYDSLFIKRVSRNLKGKAVISSDNPNVKLSEELDGSEELRIVGRVVYVWHGFFV